MVGVMNNADWMANTSEVNSPGSNAFNASNGPAMMMPCPSRKNEAKTAITSFRLRRNRMADKTMDRQAAPIEASTLTIRAIMIYVGEASTMLSWGLDAKRA